MTDNQTIAYSKPSKIPMGNYLIMLVMSVVFAFQFLGDPQQKYLSGYILRNFSFNALLVHSWLHKDLIHIVSNLLLLVIFGRHACIKIGNAKYILIYIVLGFAAALSHLVLDSRPVIGASGAIFGILGVSVVLTWRKLSSLGPWLLIIWVTLSAAAAVGSSPVAHVAHISGFVSGMILATILIIFNNVDHSDTCYSLIWIARQKSLYQKLLL